jgi:hypothetical protein
MLRQSTLDEVARFVAVEGVPPIGFSVSKARLQGVSGQSGGSGYKRRQVSLKPNSRSGVACWLDCCAQVALPGKALRTAFTSDQVERMLNSSPDTKLLMARVGYNVSVQCIALCSTFL